MMSAPPGILSTPAQPIPNETDFLASSPPSQWTPLSAHTSVEFFIEQGNTPDEMRGRMLASLDDSVNLDRSRGDDDDATGDFLRSSGDEAPMQTILSHSRNEDVVSASWMHLFTPDERTRKLHLNTITKALRQELAQASAPTVFRQLLPRIVRLAHECPFQDIKKGFQDFLELEKRKIQTPEVPRPSRFFREGILPVDTTKEPQSSMFKEIFLQTGRVNHLDRVLAWHPSYQEHFMRAYNYILRADGPLPHHMRNYIAILSAARFKCTYLVKQQEEEYLMNGGDPSWLDGIDNIPPKLQILLEVNAILAHQPWLIKPSHVEKLLRGDDPFTRWTTAELVQAFMLMATFRSLAGLVGGLGINPEVDFKQHRDGFSSTNSPNSETVYDISNDDVTQNTQQIIDKLKAAIRASVEEDTCSTAEERRARFVEAEDSAAPGSQSGTVTPGGSNARHIEGWGEFSKYIGPYTLQHQDFDVKAKDYQIYHIHEFSWEEQGYELVQRYYTGTGELLDEEFNHIFELTYNKFNDQQGIDTAPFRRSVWYYVHRIFGAIHDDYDYSLVNSLLNRRMKAYIKKMVCKPEDLVASDVSNLGYLLQPAEKCHIALLATEARKQAELLYGLHAVMKLMQS